jgi:hypothetical protein
MRKIRQNGRREQEERRETNSPDGQRIKGDVCNACVEITAPNPGSEDGSAAPNTLPGNEFCHHGLPPWDTEISLQPSSDRLENAASLLLRGKVSMR